MRNAEPGALTRGGRRKPPYGGIRVGHRSVPRAVRKDAVVSTNGPAPGRRSAPGPVVTAMPWGVTFWVSG